MLPSIYPLLSDEWYSQLRKQLSKNAAALNNAPWCLGVFVDNEIHDNMAPLWWKTYYEIVHDPDAVVAQPHHHPIRIVPDAYKHLRWRQSEGATIFVLIVRPTANLLDAPRDALLTVQQ